MSRSKVISFDSYRPNTHEHTHTADRLHHPGHKVGKNPNTFGKMGTSVSAGGVILSAVWPSIRPTTVNDVERSATYTVFQTWKTTNSWR